MRQCDRNAPKDGLVSTTDELGAIAAAIEDGPLAGRLQRNVPIGPLTTYRVGGAAALFVTLASRADVDALLAAVGGTGIDILTVGRGSNLLVADEGFAGLAIVLGPGFDDVTVDGSVVTAGAAAKLPVVARTAVQNGLSGFEWAVGVPGSIGGAVRMNAGGHGAEIVDALVAAEIADLSDGSVRWRSREELGFGYRTSLLADHDLVLGVRLELIPGDPGTGKNEMREIVVWRRDNQPGGQNAGSVFTNPEGDSAGRLIDAAGCKGLRIGTAEVSDKHANFIQADPDGRAADIVALMDEICRRVRAHHGVDLHAETRMIGFDQVAEAGTT